MAVKQVGRAYAIFKCDASPDLFRRKMSQIRAHLRRRDRLSETDITIPRAVRFVLTEGMMKVKGDDELAMIVREAGDAHMKYTITATYSDNGNKEAAIGLGVLLNQAHQSSLWTRGSRLEGELIYRKETHYMNFYTGTLHLLGIDKYDENLDLQNALNLNKMAVLASVIGPTWKDEWNISMHHIPQAYIQSGGDFFVACFKGELIGMGGLQRADENTAILKKLRVHPDFRGFGIAKRLVVLREQRAMELGYKVLHARVDEENGPMINILLSNGFRQGPKAVDSDDGVARLVFEKELK
ncbi:MAG: GNAT family N-acetyltransferase [Candidatus Micrarchaeota archaeon]